MSRKNACLVFVWFFTVLGYGIAQKSDSSYPVMTKLETSDLVFRQLVEAAESNMQNLQKNKNPDEVFIVQYTLKKDETLFSVSARCLIPYDAIVTLNGIRDTVNLVPGTVLLIPSAGGLFLPSETNRNDLDYLVRARLMSASLVSGEAPLRISVRFLKKNVIFYYYPAQRFSGTERVFFLKPDFVLPIEKPKLTSPFGLRNDPITGQLHHHSGVDLAAPLDTPVFAARAGTIKFTGWDAVLGNYIVITHENSIETVYGHLKTVKARLNQKVNSGTIIGTVGTTGRSTGPHLHFEIRISDAAKDPAKYLQGLSP
jgi:murein DD-endopeptidase MepM/ murein hydrolase activator NlpD